jgi:uncharacterized Zn-binding protein involved in type VI secretion
MKSAIRKGDRLENGGEVTGGSPYMTFMGRPISRLGDEAVCEQHGRTIIVEGNKQFADRDGKPVAMHHHQCACGCRLLSSLLKVNIA